MDPKKNLQQKKKKGIRHIDKTRSYSGLYYAGIVFAFAFILYANTLNHSYALDDNIVSRNNVFVQNGFKGIPYIFAKGFLYGFNQRNDQSYRPIALLTMAVEVGIWGEKPEIHHFFNVLYYAIACILLFFVLKRIFLKYPIILPLIIALVFAAHPVHSENVANFKSRDEILDFLFLGGLFLTLFHFIDSNKKVFLFLSLLFFFLALMTKEQAITFLALIPLLLWFFTSLSWKRIIFILTPFFAIAVIYMAIRWSILDNVTFGEKITILNNGLVAATTFPSRMATAILILGKYILLLFFPHPLSYDYSYNQIPIVSFANPWVILTVVVFLSYGVFAILGLRSKNIYSFSFFFFIFTMSVVSNIFILIGSTLGERFLLIPSVAFCMGFVFLIGKITQTNLRVVTLKKNYSFISVIAIILLLYSFKTITRNADWKNNLTLFEADIKPASESTRANAALASEYRALALSASDSVEKQKYYSLGKKYYEKSLKIYPENSYALYNYGVLEYTFGKLHEAELLYRKTIMVEPTGYNALNNLSITSFQLKHYDSALVYFKKLLESDPNNARMIVNIGAVYQRKQDFVKAIEYYKRALAIDPSIDIIYQNIISVYAVLNDTANFRYYTKQRAAYIK